MRFRGLLVMFLLFLPLVAAESQFLFTGAGMVKHNITISYPQIQGISFNVTGSNYSNGLPTNVSVDVGDDGDNEWEYKVYHTATIENATEVVAGFSYVNEGDLLTIVNVTNDTDYSLLTALGNLNANSFTKTLAVPYGYLGIITSDTISAQVISLSTNTSTTHAFLPAIDNTIPVGDGLYIAEGGSTYYCNSNHTGTFQTECNMTPSQALVPSHLAREANVTGFNLTEPLLNPRILDTINTALFGCPLPCNITISVSSESAGNITITDPIVIPPGDAANISITENATSYTINISSSLSLTSVRYFYGSMPSVHVIPFMKEDETRNLTQHQIDQLAWLNETLAEAWDNLTNSSHPLNFTFYLSPVPITGLNGSAGYSNFTDKRVSELIPSLGLTNPAVVITLDIWDYYSNDANTIKLNEVDHIGRSYINGFYNSSLRDIYHWDDDLLRKVILHELTHVFISYPNPNAEKKYYSNHPSSFTDLADFSTYNAADSPAGIEGYYSPNSLMNQLRIFTAEEDAAGPLELSVVDRMLIGICSPYAGGNYSFYTGNVTKNGTRYQATSMTLYSTTEAYEEWVTSTDDEFWDIRNVSYVGMGVNTTFGVNKSGQNSRALFVFAEDAGHPEHFAVANFNAGSITSDATPLAVYVPPPNNPPVVTAVDPGLYHNTTVLLNCSATDEEIHNISIFGNWTGWHRNYTLARNGTGNYTNLTYSLADGSYLWGCEVCDNTSCQYSANESLIIDMTEPNVTLDYPANGSTWTQSASVGFRFNITEQNLNNCTLNIGNASVRNITTLVSGRNTISYAPGNIRLNWSVVCRDDAGNTNQTAFRELVVSYTAPVTTDTNTGGGGGGGGGGGAAPEELSDNVRKKSYYEAPEEVVWDIGDFDVISFRGTKTDEGRNSEIIIVVENKTNAPADQEKVKSVFSVNGTNIGFKDIAISFRVNLSDVGDDEIVLSTYNGGWIDHETKKVSESDGYAVFQSIIPGFDEYYVRGVDVEEESVVVQEEVEEEAETDTIEEENQAPIQTFEQQDDTPVPKLGSFMPIMSAVIVVLVLLGGSLFYIVIKHKS